MKLNPIIKTEWKEIVGFPNYEVSNTGLVRRGPSSKTGWRTFPGKILKQTVNNGYHYVDLVGNKKKGERRPVHQLVLNHFSTMKPLDCECHHKDENRKNNHLNNLEWKTIVENRGLKGEKNNGSKLKEGEVWLIKKLLSFGVVPFRIAKMFKISPSTAQRIKGGKIWKEVIL